MVNSIFPKVRNDDIQVSWMWQDQNAGIIRWAFTNLSDKVQSFLLLRGAEAYNYKMEDSDLYMPYYFGDAFYPVYLQYKLTKFGVEQVPLVDNKVVTDNIPPLGVVRFGDKYLVGFVFTLGPRETYSTLEGGYVKIGDVRIIPYYPVAVKVEPWKVSEMCVSYNEFAIIDYSAQVKEYVHGYSPNPKTFTTMVWKSDGPFAQIFPSPIHMGQCESNPFNGLMNEFLKTIDQIIKNAEKEFEKSIQDLGL